MIKMSRWYRICNLKYKFNKKFDINVILQQQKILGLFNLQNQQNQETVCRDLTWWIDELI